MPRHRHQRSTRTRRQCNRQRNGGRRRLVATRRANGGGMLTNAYDTAMENVDAVKEKVRAMVHRATDTMHSVKDTVTGTVSRAVHAPARLLKRLLGRQGGRRLLRRLHRHALIKRSHYSTPSCRTLGRRTLGRRTLDRRTLGRRTLGRRRSLRGPRRSLHGRRLSSVRRSSAAAPGPFRRRPHAPRSRRRHRRRRHHQPRRTNQAHKRRTMASKMRGGEHDSDSEDDDTGDDDNDDNDDDNDDNDDVDAGKDDDKSPSVTLLGKSKTNTSTTRAHHQQVKTPTTSHGRLLAESSAASFVQHLSFDRGAGTVVLPGNQTVRVQELSDVDEERVRQTMGTTPDVKAIRDDSLQTHVGAMKDGKDFQVSATSVDEDKTKALSTADRTKALSTADRITTYKDVDVARTLNEIFNSVQQRIENKDDLAKIKNEATAKLSEHLSDHAGGAAFNGMTHGLVQAFEEAGEGKGEGKGDDEGGDNIRARIRERVETLRAASLGSNAEGSGVKMKTTHVEGKNDTTGVELTANVNHYHRLTHVNIRSRSDGSGDGSGDRSGDGGGDRSGDGSGDRSGDGVHVHLTRSDMPFYTAVDGQQVKVNYGTTQGDGNQLQCGVYDGTYENGVRTNGSLTITNGEHVHSYKGTFDQMTGHLRTGTLRVAGHDIRIEDGNIDDSTISDKANVVHQFMNLSGMRLATGGKQDGEMKGATARIMAGIHGHFNAPAHRDVVTQFHHRHHHQ